MCGRYTLSTPGDVVAELADLEAAPRLEPRYNIAPTQEAPVIREEAGVRALAHLAWGLRPRWLRERDPGRRLINARAETAAEKPAFREGLRRRRCLVPADGFYEWQGEGGRRQPFHITLRDGSLFAFAGLWEPDSEADRRTFAILTTRPNALMESIHDRMPVILPPERFAAWLDPQATLDALRPLFEPIPPESLTARAVSTWVNNPAHDDPRCLEPVSG